MIFIGCVTPRSNTLTNPDSLYSNFVRMIFIGCVTPRSYTLANPDAHDIGSPTEGPGKQVSRRTTKELNYFIDVLYRTLAN